MNYRYSAAICCYEIHELRGFQVGEERITLFCRPKDRSGNIFLLCPGLERFSAGLPLANRVVLVAVWLRNQREIPDEMHIIWQITPLERCDPDGNTGFRWRFARSGAGCI
jgi:hypothetical protein